MHFILFIYLFIYLFILKILAPSGSPEIGGEEGGGGSGWGIHVTPWLIHVNVCQDTCRLEECAFFRYCV